MEFKPGDYVIYKGPQGFELGRIVREGSNPKTYHVCYSGGCTSACTPEHLLEPIINSYLIQETSIGFNRFKDTCESYNPECCDIYCKEKGIE